MVDPDRPFTSIPRLDYHRFHAGPCHTLALRVFDRHPPGRHYARLIRIFFDTNVNLLLMSPAAPRRMPDNWAGTRPLLAGTLTIRVISAAEQHATAVRYLLLDEQQRDHLAA